MESARKFRSAEKARGQDTGWRSLIAKVLIADVQPMMRDSVRAAIRKVPGVSLQAEVADGRDVPEAVSRHKIHLVIVGWSIDGGCSFQALEDLKRHHPQIRVIVFSAYPLIEYGL